MIDEDRPPPSAAAKHTLGEALDALSIEEIDRRIDLLLSEMGRLEAARDVKRAALDAAGSLFKR